LDKLDIYYTDSGFEILNHKFGISGKDGFNIF